MHSTKVSVLLLLFAVLLHYPAYSAGACPNPKDGCVESTSPKNFDVCSNNNSLSILPDESNCGRYVWCLQGSYGYAYNCPAGMKVQFKCVPDSSCVAPCQDSVKGCLIKSYQDASISLCDAVSDGTYIDNPLACGSFLECLPGLNIIVPFQCPPNYRGNGDAAGPQRCTPDSTCSVWNDTRSAPCLNYTVGCPLSGSAPNLTLTPIPLCQNYTNNYGIFNDPSRCGVYMICVVASTGLLYQCPAGYRSQVLVTSSVMCVVDPSCTSVSAPRSTVPTGCTNTAGCLGQLNANFPSCTGKTPYTSYVDDPVRCGYFEICQGGTAAQEYFCPNGFRADTSKPSPCQVDSTCLVPATARLSLVIGPSQVPATPGGGTTNTTCSNNMYGCSVPPSSLQSFGECSGVTWMIVLKTSYCNRYIICEQNGQGLLLQCPVGYKAVTAGGQLYVTAPRCAMDPTCSQNVVPG